MFGYCLAEVREVAMWVGEWAVLRALVTCGLSPGCWGQVRRLPRPWRGDSIWEAEMVAAAGIEHQRCLPPIKMPPCVSQSQGLLLRTALLSSSKL